MPFDIKGQVIYYCGPTPPAPGRVIGAAGPTTASRMDAYAPTLLALGLKGMIGKGKRSQAVKDAIKGHKAVYFGGDGGRRRAPFEVHQDIRVIAYGDLGPEAVARLLVEDFPLFVINDVFGNDLYEMGASQYKTA